ncbi:MAG: DegT/DnrJ/EryC1/StrS family aminotransferase [Planctomycetaceae bacterium]
MTMTQNTEKPALLGGKPILEKPLPPPNSMGQEEVDAATRVIKSGVLSGFIGIPGPAHLGGTEVLALEAWYKNRFGAKHAISVNSATTALQTMVTAVDIGAGDEVIVPPYTMCATATAVLCCNAIPVFADIDSRTFNIDPADVRRTITRRTKAIIAVNLFGQPAALDELQQIADEYNLILLEDNAQGPGATFDSKWAGTIGKAGIFSLNQNKTVHCGEGGVILTNDDRVAHRCQLVRNHGEVIVDGLMSANPDERYEPVIGNNFRLPEVLAAIAHEQVKKLDQLTKPRVELASYLREQLQQFDCLTPPYLHPKATHVYFLFPMKFNAAKAGMSRATFVKAMQAENLPFGGGYVKPIYRYPIYQQPGHKCSGPFAYEEPNYRDVVCPVTEKLYNEELVMTNICRHPHTREQIDQLVRGIAKILAARDELAKL